MVYELKEDITTGSFNAKELTQRMEQITNRLSVSIDAIKDFDEDAKSILMFLLKSFVTTHASISALLKLANGTSGDGQKVRNYLYGPDAMSLVREQIEKVFSVVLICDDPQRWIKVYLKDDWRRVYERELFYLASTKQLERFREYREGHDNDMFKGFKDTSYITEPEKAWVDYVFDNDGEKPPKIDPNYIPIPEFPSAGAVLQELKGKSCEPFLKELRRDYRYICGYTHVGATKLQLSQMADRKLSSRISTKDKESYYRTQIEEPAFVTSITTSLCACTEVSKFIPNNHELTAFIVEQWETLNS